MDARFWASKTGCVAGRVRISSNRKVEPAHHVPMTAVKTFFTADLHLTAGNTRRTDLALAFFDMVARANADLYILGDLFDFWANNRIVRREAGPVLESLSCLAARGRRVGFIYGNRDFLLGPAVLRRHGISFLGETAEVSLAKRRVLLTHGHLLCLGDHRFLQYRRRIWPLFRALDRILPGALENCIARKCMVRSKQVIDMQSPHRFEFTRSCIAEYFHAGIDTVICGHRHTRESFSVGAHCFYALPAWDDLRAPCLAARGGGFWYQDFTLPTR